jgi:hypothetical protein
MNESRRDPCGRRGTILNETQVLVTSYVVRGRALVVSPAPDGCQSPLIHPATLRLVSYYHQLGLRERILTLPVMVALVLSLIWRQFSGVSELVRIIRTETLL